MIRDFIPVRNRLAAAVEVLFAAVGSGSNSLHPVMLVPPQPRDLAGGPCAGFLFPLKGCQPSDANVRS